MKRLLTVGIVLLVGGAASGATRYVNCNNLTPQPPFTNGWDSAATNIPDAVAVSSAGDLVLVTDGEYRVSQQITLSGGYTVKSVNGPSQTLVAGNYPASTNRVLLIANASAMFAGFTISNGVITADNSYGAGVYFSAHGIVSNCVIVNNRAGRWNGGAGVYMDQNGQLLNSVVANNQGAGGSYGGGVCIYSWGLMRNCAVYGNYAYRGGGIDAYGTSPVIENCTIVSNRADYLAGGVYNYTSGGGCTFRNCVIYYNALANHSGGAMTCCCTIPATGTGCVTNPPLFVDLGSRNYRLQSASPCINAGQYQSWMASATDLDSNSRIRAAAVDIGAYESPYAPIDASAGPGGSISPVGRVGVLVGSNQTFIITPHPKYATGQDVKVDGGSIGPTNVYTFYGVTSNHTIQALFLAYPDTNGYVFAEIDCDASNGLSLSWMATNGWEYTLQATSTLTPAAWSNLPPYTNMTGAGLVVITNPAGASSNMFYRLQASPAN